MCKKRIISLIVALGLIFAMLPFAGACNENVISTEIVDLGDGITVEIKTVEIVSSVVAFSDYQTRRYYKTANVKSGSTIIGTFGLQGEFQYNGSQVSAIWDDYKCTTKSGYAASGNSSHSGATVRGSATFSGNGMSKTANLTMTCDKNGNIS